MGDGSHARQSARADRGGLRRAVPAGAVSARAQARAGRARARRQWADGPRRSRRWRASAASTYEPVGGLNPVGRPAALCPGGTNRITGQLADGFWGASCDADEHEEGGLFSKTVLPGAVLAKSHVPDLAKVMPPFNVESIETRPDELVMHRASRRKVEFESIEFNKRFLATVPSDYDPIALREMFSPGFLDWVTTIDHEIDFGVSEQQLWFLWRLRERSRGRARGGARQRRRALQARPQGDRGVRRPHLSGRPLARRAGAVPGRAEPSASAARARAVRRKRIDLRSMSPVAAQRRRSLGELEAHRRACAARAPSRPPSRTRSPRTWKFSLPGEVGAVAVGGDAGPALGVSGRPAGSASIRSGGRRGSRLTGTRTASGKPSGRDPGEHRRPVAAPELLDPLSPRRCPPPAGGSCGSSGSSLWPERTSSMWAS